MVTVTPLSEGEGEEEQQQQPEGFAEPDPVTIGSTTSVTEPMTQPVPSGPDVVTA
jgi:hypothetical protein